MEYEVLVQLKPEVLDPEARAVRETLQRLGHENIQNVVISKRYILSLADDSKAGGNHQQQVDSIARDILANTVSQSVSIKRL